MSDLIATCLICSEQWPVHPSRPNNHLICLQCRRTENKIDYGMEEPCRPWHGEFDDDDNPMQSGKLFRPGNRICGHRDCVELNHIEQETLDAVTLQERLIAEQFSISYRTGKKLNYSQLMRRLNRERPKVPSGRAIMSDLTATL